jgi:HAD superfamily hydrolase (TIGR01549 family)
VTPNAAPERWVCLDVGETLVDETRIWSIWASELGVPVMTFMAAFGAILERGLQHQDVFAVLGVDDWKAHLPRVRERFGGFQTVDLYPDALDALDGLARRGYRVSVLANQPAERHAELRALGFAPEVMAMSEEMGVAKPDGAFFREALRLMGDPRPGDVAYVGDRIDNDVLPSSAAGMRAIWLRRGPWGVIPRTRPSEAALIVDSLVELLDRIPEAWT